MSPHHDADVSAADSRVLSGNNPASAATGLAGDAAVPGAPQCIWLGTKQCWPAARQHLDGGLSVLAWLC